MSNETTPETDIIYLEQAESIEMYKRYLEKLKTPEQIATLLFHMDTLFREAQDLLGKLGCFEEFLTTTAKDETLKTMGKSYADLQAWIVTYLDSNYWRSKEK